LILTQKKTIGNYAYILYNSAMSKRVFFAIKLPKNVKDFLIEEQSKIKKDIEKEIRWIEKENLHITLLFLGKLKEQKIEEVVKETHKLKIKSFNLSFSKIEYFPEEKREAKYIFVKGESSEVNLLHTKLVELTQKLACSNKENYKNFSLHVTLGRIKLWEFRKKSLYEIPEIKESVDITFPVKSFFLLESVLQKRGPFYKTVAEFPLS
jgi:RNA 2',3'-cyclic 3'-phosphodiesterase